MEALGQLEQKYNFQIQGATIEQLKGILAIADAQDQEMLQPLLDIKQFNKIPAKWRKGFSDFSRMASALAKELEWYKGQPEFRHRPIPMSFSRLPDEVKNAYTEFEEALEVGHPEIVSALQERIATWHWDTARKNAAEAIDWLAEQLESIKD